jgi:hypothetical protein
LHRSGESFARLNPNGMSFQLLFCELREKVNNFYGKCLPTAGIHAKKCGNRGWWV